MEHMQSFTRMQTGQKASKLHPHWLQQETGLLPQQRDINSTCDMLKHRQHQLLQATHLYVLKVALRRGASCRQ